MNLNPIVYLLLEIARHPLRSLTNPLSEAWYSAKFRARNAGRAPRYSLSNMPPAMAGGAGEVITFPLARALYQEQYIDPALRDNTTVNGTGIDLQAAPYRQFDHFQFLLLMGATDIVVDFKMQDSPDNSVWTDMTDADAAAVDITQLSATDDNQFAVVEVTTKGYPVARYIRGVLTVGDGTLGANTAVLLQAYGFEGETPTPVASDRAELVVPASAT